LSSKFKLRNIRFQKLYTSSLYFIINNYLGACFLGCEDSVNFLLSWNVDLNCRDNEGFTPLHLGVISKNGKIVRALLVKGSDRFI